jgi:hypothetical protein
MLVGFMVLFLTPLSGIEPRGSVSAPGVATALAQISNNAGESTDAGGTTNYLLRGGLFLLGLVSIFYLFYSLVYRLLLQYYHPDECKRLTWSMMMLYGLGWFAFGAYVLFDYGLYFSWFKWVFAFLGALWVIWFLVIVFTRKPAY